MPNEPPSVNEPHQSHQLALEGQLRLIAAAREQASSVCARTAWSQPGSKSGIAFDPSSPGPPPDSFTGYQILGELHRGGQGIVYQGIQKSTHRKVAIKVMKEGPFAGATDKARFDREVQILGQLQHPNLVAIHGTGMAAGHYYFVMDYIHGQPLDVFIAGRRHTLDDILQLFAKICDAVSAAHLRGVIHRDLKPSNIRIDDQGEPHILDFGLAKSAPSDTDASVMTVTGQFVGSLPWASPEQAEGVPGAIDVRTDVYSLGVILFQMLTGRFPYDVVGNMRDVLDRIMHDEPVRPHTIRREINDEVETILLKCLEKERDRRYQSAGELARDIRHYLDGEPIEAKRDSTLYVLRKQLRKYRLPVAIVTAFVLLVTIGLIVTAAGWRQAASQRDEARRARNEAAQQRDKAERVAKFISDILHGVSPSVALGRDATMLREMMDTAAKRIQDDELVDAPEAELQLRGTIGTTYRELGVYDRAADLLEPALALAYQVYGEEHPEVALSLNNLAELLIYQRKPKEAEPLFRKALAMRRKLLGEEHPDVAKSLTGLGYAVLGQGRPSEAEPLYREAVAMRRRLLGEEHPDLAKSLIGLAWALRDQRKLSEAEPLFSEALAINRKLLGEEHPEVASSLRTLASLAFSQGKLSEAETLYREALAMRRRLLGDEHLTVAFTLTALADLLTAQGKHSEAEPLFREALAIHRKRPGEEHPDLIYALRCLTSLLRAQGRLSEVEPLLREALAINRKLRGAEAPEDLTALAEVLQDQGNPSEAERLFREVLAMHRQLHGEGNPLVTTAISNLASVLIEQEKYDEAEPLLREALTSQQATLSEGDPAMSGTQTMLGWVLSESVWQKRDAAENVAAAMAVEAERLLRDAWMTRRNSLAADDWRLPNTENILGDAVAATAVTDPSIDLEARRARLTEAESLLLEGYQGLVDNPNVPATFRAERIRQALQRIARLYESWDAAEPGKGYDVKAAEWQAKLADTP